MSVLNATSAWLRSHPLHVGNSVLIPLRPGKKQPLVSHKLPGQWDWSTFDAFVKETPLHSDWGILLDRIVVIDCDDEASVALLESFADADPVVKVALASCAIQKTMKGLHYMFSRPSWADDLGYWDGARQVKGMNIDVKTLCKNSTRGLLSVSPSANKSWLRAPWDLCAPQGGGAHEDVHGLLPDIPESLLSKVCSRRPARRRAKSSPDIGSCCRLLDSSSAAPSPPDATILTPSPIHMLVNMLSPIRAGEYASWMRVGWCLHNIDADRSMLPLWIAFSKQCMDRFVPGECDRLWDSMRDEGYTEASLHMWAKMDSPSEYAIFMHQTVESCNGTHAEIADVAFRLLRDRYVFCNTRLWFYFDGSLWKQDKEALRIRHELSSTIRTAFLQTAHRLRAAASISDMDSISSVSSHHNRDTSSPPNRMLKIATLLQDASFKDRVMKEMGELFHDPGFLDRLDSNPALIAFTNGVWDLRESRFRQTDPDDRLSISTGFAYSPHIDDARAAQIERYWSCMHPDPLRRQYIIRTIARQLFGDHGSELFHIHAGQSASASNGKSRFFEVLEHCLGGYVLKFGVELLTQKQRIDPGKPMPEFATWRGVRILYCSEPNPTETLNSGVMKDLTGGEAIVYRLLFSNDVHRFRPQFKMHIMCNFLPQVDGSDPGVQRRVRVLSYASKFVSAGDNVDPSQHRFLKDPGLARAFGNDDALKMEFVRCLFRAYDHDFCFDMPHVVATDSRAYLADNNSVHLFVSAHVVKIPVSDPSFDPGSSFFTLKEATVLFRSCDFYDHKPRTFKVTLQNLLGVVCHEQKKINGVNCTNVFMGFRLRWNDDEQQQDQ